MKIKRYKIRTSWLRAIVFLTLQLSFLNPQLSVLSAKDFYGYTKDRPLVIVSDWDFQPYEFLNNDGEPAGYNIDVLNLILDKLDIPHKFVMEEWYLAAQMFEHREADLIHALTFAYRGHPYVQSKKYINYYNLKVARKQGNAPLTSVTHLTKDDTLMLKNNDYAALRLNEINDSLFHIEYMSPKEALTGIRNGLYRYYIWGEIPLARKITELQIDSIVLDDIDIPAGELRIIGYDKELVDIIDDEYTRLEQNGELDKIRDKWFHPERVHDDASPLAIIIIIALAIIGAISFLLNRLITLRVKNAVRRTEDINELMTTALGMGDFFVVEFDVRKWWLKNVYGNMLPEDGMSPEEYLSRLPQDQAKLVHENNQLLISGKINNFEMLLNYNTGSKDNPVIRDFYGNAIIEFEDGKPSVITYTAKEVTKEFEEERKNQALWNKYQKVFETNLVAMSFYDKNGYLLDVNEKMKELCEFHNQESEAFFRRLCIQDMPTISGVFDLKTRDVLHVCQKLHFQETGKTKYLEVRIKPVTDEKGELIYIVNTARDATFERDNYMELKKHNAELIKTNESINEYERQLGYLLEQSNIFIWYYNPKTDNIRYTRSPRHEGFTETVSQFFEGIIEDEPGMSERNMRNVIAEDKQLFAIHHYSHTPAEPSPVWYAISGIPLKDNDGNTIEYFGIARNITDLMEAQQRLKEETNRAEDSGRLKAAFLANMTHEIRTPLNAIVGFSDILQIVDTPEERLEFIRIIRNNCDMLLRLINDILEASSMGQALAIEPTECDFSQVFDDICQTLEQRVSEAGIPFIKDNPYPTFKAKLDKGRIQQVLTNFTTNAVKYTKTGHIKVGYREQDGGIYFYCEDTGAGIPKDKQAAVFERFVKLNDFVQGTGLGLSICKSIAERCNGRIGVFSEGEGHGSTFWLWTPREITPMG